MLVVGLDEVGLRAPGHLSLVTCSRAGGLPMTLPWVQPQSNLLGELVGLVHSSGLAQPYHPPPSQTAP